MKCVKAASAPDDGALGALMNVRLFPDSEEQLPQLPERSENSTTEKKRA